LNIIVKSIKKTTGLSINEFCEKELFTEYKAFAKRMKDGRFHPAEIFYIVYRTKKSSMELFGKPWHELFITAKESELDQRVKKILDKMSPSEKEKMDVLLFNKSQAPATTPGVEKPSYNTPLKDVTIETPKEDPKPGIDFFINSY
jgi:hypothetical protein